ncbi:MAG: metallophosphoesterase [Opitutales bacterium]|nr:metallophosphoesterase [Opitutales bacterium]
MKLCRRNFMSSIFGGILTPIVVSCKKSESVKMLSFADIHCDDDRADDGAKDYKMSFSKVQSAISKVRNEKFDCVLNFGDIVEGEPAQLQKMMGELSSVGVPVKNVLGNHDLRCKPEVQHKMMSMLFEESKSYYSFDVKNWRFFVLDSMRLSRVSKIKNERCTNESAYWLAKVKGKENGVVWGGGVDSEQLEWLENGLKKATQENKKVAVLCHMTIFPFTHASMFNHEQIAEILENNKCVKAFICGHLHEGGYVQHNSVHYLTMQSILQNKEPTFSTLEFCEDKIVVKGFGKEVSRTLNF